MKTNENNLKVFENNDEAFKAFKDIFTDIPTEGMTTDGLEYFFDDEDDDSI